MIGNKNSSLLLLTAVLLMFLAIPAQAKAADPGGLSALAKFNLSPTSTPEEAELELKKNSPLNPDLRYRVAFGRAPEVAALLKQGADPNTVNASDYSALVTAITRKDDEAAPITRALLEAGANPNAPTPEGNYPVVEVVKSGRADVLQALIDHHAVLIYAEDEKGRDLKTLAEARGDESILAILNPAWEREEVKIQELKKPGNFIKLAQEYAFLNCANAYLNYYISTSPEGVDMNKFNKIIESNLQETKEVVNRIQFSFNVPNQELANINSISRRDVVKMLNGYKTNHNRKINGIGTDRDLNNRCGKIAKKWNSRNMDKNAFKQFTK